MNASSPEFTLSLAGLLVLVLFASAVVILHCLIAKKKFLRRRYLIILAVVFLATLFVPVVDGGAKFGWIPVAAAYPIVPGSIFRSDDDLIGIFALCYGVIAVHNLLSIGVAHILTRRKKNA